jgi:hypothetical protein
MAFDSRSGGKITPDFGWSERDLARREATRIDGGILDGGSEAPM